MAAGGENGHTESRGAILAAFLANLGIAIAKFIGFLITSSSSLLAESIHSVADSSNQGLLFLGGVRAKRPPTPLHPFGYARSRYFWAFMVAVVLFCLGGLFSLYEGYEKIIHPHEISSPAVAFGIFGVAIVFEAFALRTAVRHARPHKGRLSWREYIRTSRSPELPVLLLEDSGALIGLVFATTGVALSQITGEPVFDGIGTLAIGILLVCIGIVLAIEMKSLLMGEAASDDILATLDRELVAPEGAERLTELLTQHLGPEELLVAAKVRFDDSLSGEEVAALINECERRVREAVPVARRIYIEPAQAPPPPEPPSG